MFANLIATETLARGVYQAGYREDGALRLRRLPGSSREFFRAYGEPELLRRAQGVLVIGGDYARSALKYGNRAALHLALEAGHAAQNILLTAAELEIAAAEIGCFTENEIRRLLNWRQSVIPLTTIVFGEDAGAGQANVVPESPAVFHWVDTASLPARPDFHIAAVAPRGAGIDADHCWGRSRDALEAHDKAQAEAVERLACASPKALFKGSAGRLPNVLDPRTCIAYSARQYARKEFPFRPFDPALGAWWTEGVNIGTGRRTAVLADLVFYGDRLPVPRSHRYTEATSSGVAAYSSAEGALERAVLELCERDAFMRTWLARLPTPFLPANELPAAARTSLSRMRTLGLRTVIKALPCPLVPVFLVFAQNIERGITVVSAAAHYDAEAALDHAVMEAEAAVLVRLASGARRTISPRDVRFTSDHADLYAQRAHFRRADFLAEKHDTASLQEAAAGTARTWSALKALLHRQESRIIALDITPAGAALDRGRLPLRVVRAIVPGLIPINFGYATEPLGLAAFRSLNPASRTPHPFS